MSGEKERGVAVRRLKMLMRLWVTFVILFALTFQAFAKEEAALAGDDEDIRIAVDVAGRREGYSATMYDNTNGLPTAEANAIAQTREGFIWIGSYGGLIRYDGNSFERMDSTTGIASVVSLFVDSKNRLWIGTNDSGVAVFDRGSYRMFNKAEGLRSASVRAVVEDDDGLIYVATTAGINMIDDGFSLGTVDDPRLSDVYIKDLKTGADGLVYGVTQAGDLFSLDEGRVTDYIDSARDRIKDIISIYPDDTAPGFVYVGTEDSNVYYGRLSDGFEDIRVFNVSPLSAIESFKRFGSQLWICAGNGIGWKDGDSFSTLRNVPMNNSVGHVMADYEGNLWFTSTRQGVMKIVPNRFADLFDICHLEEKVVNTTCMLDDMLFIGTDDGLMVLRGRNRIDKVPLKTHAGISENNTGSDDLLTLLNGCRIRSIIRDSKDRLWISTWRKYGLLCYDKGDLTAYTMKDGLFSDRIRTVCEGAQGEIYVANTGGVSIIKDGAVTGGYGEADGIENSEILTIARGPEGEIAMGTDGGGIFIAGTGTTHHIDTDDGLSSGVVMRIKWDEGRHLYWIVTSNSIEYMTPDHKVVKVQKFPYSNNFDLYENANGDMWILSSNGVYVVSSESLVNNGEIDPEYYGRDNGLPCIATANSYSELTQEGDLYIAGSTGVACVNINREFDNLSDLRMAVPYVDADSGRIYPDEDGVFHIGSDIKKLTIYSYVFNYSLTNPQVTYSLEGFDEDEKTLARSALMPLDYTNLRGGTYTFVMRLNDTMGRSASELRVQVVKELAFYEMPVFYILCLALALFAIFGMTRVYVRGKTRAFLKKQEENRILIREITTAFSKIIDMKDRYTNGHSERVARYTAKLAKELGYDEETIDKYYDIAMMHDIGKIGVPAEVLNKPGKLTDEEFNIIKSHSARGYNVLKEITIMPELAIGAGAHHERPDGRGYPRGLKNNEIPRVAQIIAVADTFDAMYSDRPYRKRMNFEKAVSIMKDAAGTQLAADVVDAFLALVEKGEFKDPFDDGGGTTEDIDNIHARQNSEEESSEKKD